MKEFFKKYWKKLLYGLAGIIALVILWKGSVFIYKNTYDHDSYQYATKSVQNQTFDQNVTIVKNIKRNGLQGDITLTFDKKDLNEEYSISLDNDISPTNVEVGVIGKVNSGDMTIKLLDIDRNNAEVFSRTVSGLNVKEVSTPAVFSKNYKLIITSNAAQNGELEVKFKFN